MNFILIYSLVILSINLSTAHILRLHNRCAYTVWPGILGNAGKGTPASGGFSLAPGATHDITVGNGWGGRVWGRTQCNSGGHCVTGDCGNKISCNGAGGVPPVSLAEFLFDGSGQQDYYDISLVDGYNIPLQIAPIDGTARKKTFSNRECTIAGYCFSDLNTRCPSELAVRSNGKTVACKSACVAFNTDEYCCRGAHNTAATCKSTKWKKDYAAIFKGSCADAYSYAYDDTTSTFTCRSTPTSGYEVRFCQ